MCHLPPQVHMGRACRHLPWWQVRLDDRLLDSLGLVGPIATLPRQQPDKATAAFHAAFYTLSGQLQLVAAKGP
jgi:hypothetical protein